MKHGRKQQVQLFFFLLCAARGNTGLEWRDCSAAADGHSDPGSMGPYAIIVDRANVSFPVYRPSDLTAAGKWPSFVFMHGNGCDDRFESPSLLRWASHGFIVVAPLMGNDRDCHRYMRCVFIVFPY